MNTALERGEAGMVNPRKEHLERFALEHVEEILKEKRTTYGDEIVPTLSAHLLPDFGNGFSARNSRSR